MSPTLHQLAHTHRYILRRLSYTIGAFAQNVDIPDVNFKTCLLQNEDINTNMDNEIQVSEAEAFTGKIRCRWLDITDITGLSFFII